MATDLSRPGPAHDAHLTAGPPTLPAGWFALAHLGELRRRAVLPRTLAGREVVVFCTAAGRVAALPAHCPHLGAHLGHGGRVEGEALVCPFHGLRFDVDGRCVGTGYGSAAPAGLRAGGVEVRVVDDAVVAWWDPESRGPSFEIPAPPPRRAGPWRWARRRLTGHPQETTENSVDIGHLRVLHGYRSVEQTAPLELDGPHLTVAYRARRPARLGGFGRRDLEIEFGIDVWGLGWSRVEVRVPRYGLAFRQLVLATARQPGEIDLLLGVAVADGGGPGEATTGRRLVAPLLASAAVRGAIGAGILGAVVYDVAQDARIWAHKVHVARPPLVPGDGPLIDYRRWARQFYADPT
ncbi:MAG TPA: Rieske 2Fe-2S domain-containing protein [Acidimicrobiales bacterium]|nr:Rieske 2Fe-2S domain-containing protein [Acidimicrobiales bacterium]